MSNALSGSPVCNLGHQASVFLMIFVACSGRKLAETGSSKHYVLNYWLYETFSVKGLSVGPNSCNDSDCQFAAVVTVVVVAKPSLTGDIDCSVFAGNCLSAD